MRLRRFFSGNAKPVHQEAFDLHGAEKNGKRHGATVQLPPPEMSLSYYTYSLKRWIALLGLLHNQGLIKSEQAFRLLHQHTYMPQLK